MNINIMGGQVNIIGKADKVTIQDGKVIIENDRLCKYCKAKLEKDSNTCKGCGARQ